MRSPYVWALLSMALGLSTRDASAQAAWADAAKKAAPPAPPPPNAMTGEAEPKTSPKFNNEGTFKVSGSKGSGAVGGTVEKKKKTQPAATTTTKVAKATTKKASANIAQWPGFRITDDGGSEVMVEFSSNPSPPTEHRAVGSVTYVFKGAHVIKSNNQNPLITVHFNTPVVSARLVPKKGELHLVVDMRPGASAAPSFGLRTSADGDGQQFYVKFGAGAWLPKGADSDEIAPAPTQKLEAKGAKSKSDNATEPKAKPVPKTESGGKTGPAP